MNQIWQDTKDNTKIEVFTTRIVCGQVSLNSGNTEKKREREREGERDRLQTERKRKTNIQTKKERSRQEIDKA